MASAGGGELGALTHIAPARAEHQVVRLVATRVLLKVEGRSDRGAATSKPGARKGGKARLHAVQRVSQAGDHHGDAQLPQEPLRSPHDLQAARSRYYKSPWSPIRGSVRPTVAAGWGLHRSHRVQAVKDMSIFKTSE